MLELNLLNIFIRHDMPAWLKKPPFPEKAEISSGLLFVTLCFPMQCSKKFCLPAGGKSDTLVEKELTDLFMAFLIYLNGWFSICSSPGTVAF